MILNALQGLLTRPKPTVMYLTAGQSNGVGAGSRVLSTTPNNRHARFNAGVRTPLAGLGPIQPLFEQVDSYQSDGAESIASAFAAHLDRLTRNGQRTLHANHALSSAFLANINKGQTPYTIGMAQVDAAVRACPGITVGGILFIHGESDTQNGTSSYPTNLSTLQSDYDTDIKAKTGQPSNVIMYCLQNPAYPPGSAPSIESFTKTGCCQLTYLSKAISDPDKFVCIGPAYFTYYQDGLHYLAEYTRVLGAYFAKAVYRKQTTGSALPLYMTDATRTGTTVVCNFHVPVAPLVWRHDLHQPRNSGNTGAYLGFKFFDDSGSPVAVTNAQITGDTEVTLTLADIPTGTEASEEIRYGWSTALTTGSGGGPLADSDPDVDQFGHPLPNFCCHCYVPVTVALFTSGLIGEWRFDQASGPYVHNDVVTPRPTLTNMVRLPEQHFSKLIVSSVTVTDNFAATNDGDIAATRLQFAAGSAGGRFVRDEDINITGTGDYTGSIWVKSNTAGTQTFRFDYGGGQRSADFTATTTWQQLDDPQNLSAGRIIGICNDSAGTASDILIYGLQLVPGLTAPAYVRPAGHVQVRFPATPPT